MVDARTIDLVVSSSGTALSLVGLICALLIGYLERGTRRFLVAFFGAVNVYALVILVRTLIQYQVGQEWAVLSRIAFFVQALLSATLTMLLMGFLLRQSGEERWWTCWEFRLSAVLWGIYVVLLVSTQHTGATYMVHDDNSYTRGPYFPLLMVPPLIIMAINAHALWRRRGRLSPRQRFAFATYILLPTVAMLVQTAFPGIHLIVFSTVVAALVMFFNIVGDQVERGYLQQEENARLKIDILLAQIQPHFLFNSLTTIKYLCRKDPELAERAVTDFSSYLRHNMDSLTVDHPIPFEEELEHVRVFLSLQTLRFGNELQVVYDLACTDFAIPTLTLQPIVENAVFYGVRRSESGSGTVTIRTRRLADRVEVSVMDDGPGFVNEALPDDAGRSHTGIHNVRERLQRVCGGELAIESVVGEGTTATIVLPQEGNAEEAPQC